MIDGQISKRTFLGMLKSFTGWPDDIRPSCAFPCTMINSDSGEYAESRVAYGRRRSNRKRQMSFQISEWSDERGPSNRIGRPLSHCGGGENYISLFSEPLMMKGGREEVARVSLLLSSLRSCRCCRRSDVNGQRTLGHLKAVTINPRRATSTIGTASDSAAGTE